MAPKNTAQYNSLWSLNKILECSTTRRKILPELEDDPLLKVLQERVVEKRKPKKNLIPCFGQEA